MEPKPLSPSVFVKRHLFRDSRESGNPEETLGESRPNSLDARLRGHDVLRSNGIPQSRWERTTHGFTLLELMLVLLIIAVAAALVGPAVGSRLTRADARRTAVQLRSAVELMRVHAVRSGQEEVMVVDPQENAYWREGGGEAVGVSPENGVLSARSRWMRENGQVEFHFYPDGTNSGGAIRVEQGRGAAAAAYVVFLDPLLGIASIWRDE